MTARWQYKALLVEFQKDGILGEKYIDEEEAEAVLNEEGRRGWELVTASMTPEGMMLFCKKELPSGPQPSETAEEVPETVDAEEVSDDGTLGSIRIF